MKILKLVIYFVLVCVPFFIEHSPQFWDTVPCAPDASESSQLSDRIFNWLAKGGYRDIRSRYTAVVLLKQRELPDSMFDDVCDQRRLIAAALWSIRNTRPAMIVIDKWYSPTGCANQQRTAELLNAVQNLDVPVVIGLDNQRGDEIGPINERERAALQKGCLILVPSMIFPDGHTRHVYYGLIRANADIRKVALQWQTYGSRSALATQSPKAMDTLAFIAATTHDSPLLKSSSIQELLRKKHHPFTAFLRSEEIPSISVAELLCGQSFPGITFPACDLNRAASVLSGKVVLIGEEHDRDRIDTPVEKRMAGVFLQANYVESLLDGHFLRPVSRLLETALVLVWILFLEFWFDRKGIAEAKALLALAIGLVLWMVCAFITLLTGYFMLLWGIPAALAIGTKYLDARIDSVRTRALGKPAP